MREIKLMVTTASKIMVYFGFRLNLLKGTIMENFKHLPEPFRIRVVEPVKRTTRAYRGQAIVEAGMNPFLLDSDDVFIDTDRQRYRFYHSTHASCDVDGVMKPTAAWPRILFATANAVKDIFGYELTIYSTKGAVLSRSVPVLIKKREIAKKKDWNRSKMVALSNYFFDTTQGHTQVNCCVAKKRLYQRSVWYLSECGF